LRAQQIEMVAVKAVVSELRKKFKGLSAHAYGHCCWSDYDSKRKTPVDKDNFVQAKLYKGGLNNNYYYGKFDIGDSVYFAWSLSKFNLDDVIQVMEDVGQRWGFVVKRPIDDSKCIIIRLKESEDK
jgi:hypothetical protein